MITEEELEGMSKQDLYKKYCEVCAKRDKIIDEERQYREALYMALEALEKDPSDDAISRQGLINDINTAIKATNMNDTYSVGLRNGMRLIKSFIDNKKPEYEKCYHEEDKSEPDAVSFKVDGDVVLKYEYMFGSGEDDLAYKTNVVMTKEIFQECYEKWIKPDVQIVCKSCACRKKGEE